MGVMTTHAGCANMVGVMIDSHPHPKLMGTLAGDNTLLVIVRSNDAVETVLGRFSALLKR